MKKALLALLLFVAVVIAVSVSRSRDEDPPVFTKVSLSEARRIAGEHGMLVVVKATAAWCGPCKTMNRTTWRDGGVVGWVNQNAIAIQLDVDREPELARTLRVEAMPTTIVLRGERELGRVVGYQSAAELLAFLRRAAEDATP